MRGCATKRQPELRWQQPGTCTWQLAKQGSDGRDRRPAGPQFAPLEAKRTAASLPSPPAGHCAPPAGTPAQPAVGTSKVPSTMYRRVALQFSAVPHFGQTVSGPAGASFPLDGAQANRKRSVLSSDDGPSGGTPCTRVPANMDFGPGLFHLLCALPAQASVAAG